VLCSNLNEGTYLIILNDYGKNVLTKNGIQPQRKEVNMLKVTAAAKEKLKEVLQKRTTDPKEGMRIIPSPSNPKQLAFVLDKEKEGDHAVESEEGRKVLLIGPELAPSLEGKVLDYQETAEGAGFSILMPGLNT
jgi:Fe-S cluster assembly iron-binding protein IscA